MSHYGTADEFTAYIEARGVELPAAIVDPEAVEAALLVASEWLDNVYGSSLSGYKTGGFLQAREWPRTNAITNTYPEYQFASNEIPDRVKEATYEAAIRQLNEAGSLLKDYTPNKYKRVAIDGAISVEYAGFTSASDIQTKFTKIDQIMTPLLDSKASGSFSSLSGGVSRV